jgi:hypothetical protein
MSECEGPNIKVVANCVGCKHMSGKWEWPDHWEGPGWTVTPRCAKLAVLLNVHQKNMLVATPKECPYRAEAIKEVTG